MYNTRQSNLDSFLNIKNPRKTVFFIDWTQEKPISKWLVKKPKNCDFSATIHWRYIGDILLCCKEKTNEILDERSKKILNKINSGLEDEERKILSFMKSHLQKSIRRRKQYAALKSAKFLLMIDKDSLFRRLSIIMMEDSKLKLYFIIILGYFFHVFNFPLFLCSPFFKVIDFFLLISFKF